jgi:hypothetical protein
LLIAALALLALIFASPAYNALFLAIETILIGLYFLATGIIDTINASTIILLLFFCLITLSSNIYIEKSTQISPSSASKISALIGGILLIFFYIKLSQLESIEIIDIKINYSFFGQDIMAIMCAVFTIFVMLISALAVINTKNIE